MSRFETNCIERILARHSMGGTSDIDVTHRCRDVRAGTAMTRAAILAAFQNQRWYNRNELAAAMGHERLMPSDTALLDLLMRENVIQGRRVKHVGLGISRWEYRLMHMEDENEN